MVSPWSVQPPVLLCFRLATLSLSCPMLFLGSPHPLFYPSALGDMIFNGQARCSVLEPGNQSRPSLRPPKDRKEINKPDATGNRGDARTTSAGDTFSLETSKIPRVSSSYLSNLVRWGPKRQVEQILPGSLSRYHASLGGAKSS